MPRATRLISFVLLLLTATACAGGGSGGSEAQRPTETQGNEAVSAPICPTEWQAGWQRLADRIQAPVYCPSWLPEPLTGELKGRWHAMDSVLKDRSYLMGFLWYEANIAEMHVNFRGYPGRTSIPPCDGKPCFSDPGVKKRIAGRDIQVYNVNRGADTWHVLYAWKTDGSLYAVSQHVVPALGLPYGVVTATLDRIVRGLVEVEPQTS